MTTDIASYLHDVLHIAGIAIDGVSIGRPHDRSTWRVSPPALQSQAQPIIDAYVAPTEAQALDAYVDRQMNEKKIVAMASALYECIPTPTMTKPQFRARAKALFKTLP